LQPSGETQWTRASTNYVVTTGDRLYTDKDSRAELEVGHFAVRMSQTTDLTIANLDDRILQLSLGQGSIRVTVFDLPPENSVEIDTGNGTLTVLRAGFYRVDVNPDTESTLVSVNSGTLQVSGGGVSQTVDGGQAVQLTGTDPIQISSFVLPNKDEFDEWCEKRDHRIRSFASRQYVNPYIPGVEDLDTFGHWQVTVEYGAVWFPAAVPIGWVPYRFGRWVWIEPWGWTWIEDEPWGFCQFHFGRWALLGSVWGWVPGPITVLPVYAPAFVAFLGGGGFSIGIGFGVQAWFPLGPGEPFFPWYHHGERYLRQVNITNVRNVTNITNIINVTNVNNIHYAYRNVAMTAVPADVFRTGQPVARRIVHVAPQQLARAQVVPHPNVTPAPTAVFGGRRPVNPPPVRIGRVAPPATRAPRVGPPAARPYAQPPLARNFPPLRPEVRENPRTPPPAGRNRVVEPRAPTGPPPAAPPRVVPRTPLPPRNVPFAARQPALATHPGRPLEPQQRQNLAVGRPAGPMRDREFPPHPPGWRSPPATRPPARPQPQHR